MEDMSPFDYVTLVFAIPIGLAIVEIAQGLSLSLRQRAHLRVGWLTPLLAVFVLFNTAALLEIYWIWRPAIDVGTVSLVSVLTLSIVYYVAASFIFPHEMVGDTDLDAWFMENRLWSLGGTFLIFAAVTLSELFISPEPVTPDDMLDPIDIAFVLGVFVFFFLAPVVVALHSERKGRVLGAMIFLLAVWVLLLPILAVE